MRSITAFTCLLGMCWSGCTPIAHAPRTTPLVTPDQAATRQLNDSDELIIELGNSVEGRPLTLTVFGDTGPAVFIMAGIHGDEPNSVDIAQDLISYLREHQSVYVGRRVGILPAANPDGLAKRSRANANRVDLNRNFPSRDWQRGGSPWMSHGDGPLSEPETKAIHRAMAILNPVRTVSIHAIGHGQYCTNYDGPAGDLAAVISSLNGYPVQSHIGYPTPGSFGNWVGIDRQIPSITLELPKGHSGAMCWTQNCDGLLAFIRGTELTASDAR